MGKNIRRLLKFAIEYPGWHTWAGKTERLRQDHVDMQNSRQTQFTRCSKCGHLHDSGWECPNCKVDTCADCGGKGKKTTCPYHRDIDDKTVEVILCGECYQERCDSI